MALTILGPQYRTLTFTASGPPSFLTGTLSSSQMFPMSVALNLDSGRVHAPPLFWNVLLAPSEPVIMTTFREASQFSE